MTKTFDHKKAPPRACPKCKEVNPPCQGTGCAGNHYRVIHYNCPNCFGVYYPGGRFIASGTEKGLEQIREYSRMIREKMDALDLASEIEPGVLWSDGSTL